METSRWQSIADVSHFPDAAKNPEECCQANELVDILLAEVDRLSPGSKRAIQMCIFDEIPQIRAARELNVTVTAIKARVFRGKQVLNATVCRRLARPS